MKILLIDNYDSFTFNLKRQLEQVSGISVDVYKYDSDYAYSDYGLIVISPGPGHPSDYKIYNEILETNIPTIGVCLGMQILNVYYGGEVGRLDSCVHGQVAEINYYGEPESVAVYNSLYCSAVPDCFDIKAFKGDIPMVIKHKTEQRLGMQFHPESFLTENGDNILKDALISSGIIFED